MSFQESATHPGLCICAILGKNAANSRISTSWSVTNKTTHATMMIFTSRTFHSTMAPSRSAPFRNEHAMPVDKKIYERGAATKTVLPVSCLFCVHFGCEKNDVSKRNRTTNGINFKKACQVGMYRPYLLSQHLMRLREFFDFSGTGKASFFWWQCPSGSSQYH